MLATLIDLYTYVLVASVLLSWVSLPPENPLVVIVDRLTAPVLGPLRKVMPSLGGLDFAPVAVIFGLAMLKRLVD